MRRRMLASVGGKPLPYLRRVAYLESDGSCFVNVGTKPIDLQNAIMLLDVENPYAYDAGIWCLSENYVGYTISVYQYRWRFAGTKGWNWNTPLSTEHKRVIFRVTGDSTELLENGTVFFVDEGNGFSRNLLEINLFNSYLTAVGNPYRIYSFALTGNVEYNYSLIPVLDLTGTPCFYDEVSGQFFYNQGTGEFTWGELGE